MRILITGSRTWTDVSVISSAIAEVVREYQVTKEETVIVHGACPQGADAIADAVVRAWDANVEAHPANWSLGKAAGFIRNSDMVALGADICLAFIKDKSKGASMTANIAQQAGIPTRIFRA